MTKANQQILALIAELLEGNTTRKPAIKSRIKPYAPKLSPAVTDRKLDSRLSRLSAIANGFKRKGLKIEFNNETGRFDNVKPYKLWLADGRIVRKGEHGVKGMFHITQTEVHVVARAVDIPTDAVVGSQLSS